MVGKNSSPMSEADESKKGFYAVDFGTSLYNLCIFVFSSNSLIASSGVQMDMISKQWKKHRLYNFMLRWNSSLKGEILLSPFIFISLSQ